MKHSWTFQRKVTAGFGVMVILAAAIAAVAILSLRSVVTVKDRVITVDAENLIGAARLESAVDRQAAAFRGFMVNGEERFLSERNAATEEFLAILTELEARGGPEAGVLTDIRRADVELLSSQDQVITTRRSPNGLAAALRTFDQDVLPKRERLARDVKGFVDRQHRTLDVAVVDANQRASM